MEIKNLTRKQTKEVLNAVNSWIEDGENANNLKSKIEKALDTGSVERMGWMVVELPSFFTDHKQVVLSGLTSDDVNMLIKAIDEEISDLRDEVDTSVGEIDATDGNESIKSIREHLKDASEKAESVELLEDAKKVIEKQNVDHIIKEKDEEINSLKDSLS